MKIQDRVTLFNFRLVILECKTHTIRGQVSVPRDYQDLAARRTGDLIVLKIQSLAKYFGEKFEIYKGM